MSVETEAFCGLCANYKPLPTRVEKQEYPWCGYDIFYIDEGICSKDGTTVCSLYEGCECYKRNSDHFKTKEAVL